VQEDAKLHLKQDRIVRATAGAGKTTRLIEDVYKTYAGHKKAYGKNPRILLTTFTVKAANELSERLFSKAIIEGDKEFISFGLSSNLEIGTMHSIFSSLLNQIDPEIKKNNSVSPSYKYNCAKGFFAKEIERHNAQHLFLEPYDFNSTLDYFIFLERTNCDYNFFDRKTVFELSKIELLKFVDEISENSQKIRESSSYSDFEKIQTFLDPKTDKALLTALKKECLNSDFIDSFFDYNEQIKSIYKSWSQAFSNFVNEKGLYTLEDMESLLLKISENVEIQKRWDYCFFDEYQDTSPEQKKLIDRFCKDSAKYFVGDPFQSIYFFRGARKEIFDQEFDRIKNENNNIEYRVKSFRSSRNIVNFVNCTSKKMFSDFDKMMPVKEDSGRVQVAFFEDGDIDDEIDFVIQKIRELDDKDVLVLSKQIKNLSKTFKKLNDQNIPALPLYGSGVADHLKSFELINFIKFLADQENEEALKVLIFSDLFKFSDDEISNYLKESKTQGRRLWEIVKENDSLSFIKTMISNKLRYSESVKLLISISNYFASSVEYEGVNLDEINSFKILNALENEEKKAGFNVEAFCDDLLSGLFPFGKESVESSNACRLMTVHGSKGLEAKHVFIIGANQGYRDLDNYPIFFDEKSETSAAKVKDKDLNRSLPLAHQALIDGEKLIKKEEHRRLFYVAMTRAEESLYVVGSGRREKNPSEPSWMTHVLKACENPELSFVDMIDDYSRETDDDAIAFNLRKHLSFFKNDNPLSLSFSKEEPMVKEFKTYDSIKLSLNIKKGINFHEYMEGSFAETKDYKNALNYLEMQRAFPFKDIYNKGFKEWGYDWLNPETKMIESGKIDLWAEIGETVWIVDYKTGSLSGVDKGVEQLKRYMAVLKAYMSDEKKYKLVLTFPFKQETTVLDG
jgi:ATP-dependent exoDNAse (exonuclease V) beta subunit